MNSFRSPGQHALDIQLVGERDGQLYLQGTRCSKCERTYYPPRALCPDDLSDTEPVALQSEGTLYESAVVRLAPNGFQPPYRVAWVDLADGVRVFGLLRLRCGDDHEPVHGDRVIVGIEVVRHEPEVVGPCFRIPLRSRPVGPQPD